MKHRVKSLSLALGLAFISNQNMALAQTQNVEAVRDVLGRQSALKQESAAHDPATSTSFSQQAGDDKPAGDASSASSVDADAEALQVAIRQAIQDLQVRRKAQQQALAAQTAQSPNRHAPDWPALQSTQKIGSSRLQTCGMSSPQLTGMPGCNLQVSYPKCRWPRRTKPKTG